MKPLPFSGPNMLGIDLGSHSIKVVETRFSFGRPKVLNAVYLELESPKTTDRAEKQGVYAAALKKLLKDNDIRTRRAVIEIPAKAVTVKITKAPAGGARHAPAEPEHASFEKREAETCEQLLEGAGSDGKPDRALLHAAGDRNAIADRIETIKAAGLIPVVADTDAFAVLNLYMLLEKPSPTDTVVLLDMGASATNIALISNGVVKVIRTVFRAGNNFTRAIQGELVVSFAAAELLKKKYGLLNIRPAEEKAGGPGTQPAAAGRRKDKPEGTQGVRIHDLLAGQVNEVVAEVRRTVAYLKEKHTDAGIRISKVALAGGSADMPGLAEYLNAELAVPVEVFRPFKKMDLKSVKARSLAWFPGFAAAAGLGLRRPKEHGRTLTEINFLPKEPGMASHPAAKYAVYALVALLLCTGGYGYSRIQERLEAQSLRTRAELAMAKMHMKQVKGSLREKKPASSLPKAARSRPKPNPGLRYAYLRDLEVNGVFKDSTGVRVLLSNHDKSMEIKNENLYDDEGKVVADVSALVSKDSVILSGGDEKYELPIP